MLNKSKKSKKDDQQSADNASELEKKVDRLLSVELQDSEPKSPKKVTESEDAETIQVVNDISSLGEDNTKSAPLLPDDLLPEELKDIDPSPKPKKKFYEPSGPKPIAPKQEEVQVNSKPSELKDELGLEDPKTNQAVDEIIASDSDELLSSRDGGFVDEVKPSKKKSRGLKALLKNKYFRRISILIVLAIIAGLAAFPSSRYLILNSLGVRAGASIKALDETTGQPLKNVEFSIGGSSAKSGSDGEVKLENLKLGPAEFKIKKAGFEEVSQNITLGWGSNPLGEFKLKSVGNQFEVKVVDFLSKKPLAKVEAINGDSSAISNDNGEITITLPNTDSDEVDIKLSKEGLREETISLKLGQQDPQVVEMASARKHAFISKRSGTYDVYKVDIDGKNEEKVLAGTGQERPESIALSSHPSKNIVALVSSRDSSANRDSKAMSSLTIINLDNNKISTVANSERLQMIGWVDNKLAFVKIAENTEPTSADRHKLIAYDIVSAHERELASTNYFNDILLANNAIYYTPSSYNVNGNVGLFKTNIEGNNRKTIYDKEAWNILRTSYGELSISMGQDWYTLSLSDDSMVKANGAPPSQKSRIYVANPFGGSSNLWTDERDGKGVLLSYNKDDKQDSTLQTGSGIKNPVKWLNSKEIIYRVGNSQETADYIMSLEGGEPVKIRDVTDTASIDRWYYY